MTHDEDNPPPNHLRATFSQAGIPLAVIPQSGHALMEDNPHDFYAAIGNFLDSTKKGGLNF